MRAVDLFHETNTALSANKGRSALTVLGIVIGIMAVVIMVSLITGFEAWLEDNIGLGAARVVTVTSDDDNHALQYDDAEFLQSVISDYETVIPQATSTATYGASNSDSTDSTSSESTSSSISLQVVGVDPEYFEMADSSLAYGALYTADAGMAVVLTEDTVEDVYGSEDYNPVGQGFTIGNNTYEVVGVIKSSSLASGMSLDVVYMPYQTMCDAVLGATQVDTLLGLVSDDADVSYVAAQTEGVLAAHHNVEYDEDGEQDVYSAATTEAQLEYLQTFTMAFDAIAAMVAGIALLVGGIGIMNMMLTNVTERYREIGLRKSLGARPSDIRMQFLSESVVLCVTGGVVGTIAGYAGAWGIAGLVPQFYSDLEGLTPIISPVLIVIVFGVCAAIGVIFGYYPARRASKLNPAETLRYQ